jgi:hypothetical protein
MLAVVPPVRQGEQVGLGHHADHLSVAGRVRLRGMVGVGTDGRPAMINPAYDLLG